MNVIQDSKTTFRVKADSKSYYMVDLAANGHRGQCNCKQFKCRIQPAWNKGQRLQPCKHILLAGGYALWNKMHK